MIGLGAVGRFAAVFAAATAGSWAGRVIAASRYGEPIVPLLKLDQRTLLYEDVAPGFLAAELVGRNLRMGLAGEVAMALAGAAASQVATGPLMNAERGARNRPNAERGTRNAEPDGEHPAS